MHQCPTLDHYFGRRTVDAEALVADVGVPDPPGPDVQAERGGLAAADGVRLAAIVRVDAVVGRNLAPRLATRRGREREREREAQQRPRT